MIELRSPVLACSKYDRRRWVLGVSVSPTCGQMVVTLLASHERGLESSAEVAAFATAKTRHARNLFRRILRGSARPSQVAVLASQLAETQASLIEELGLHAAGVWDRIVAVGVYDAGLWRQSEGVRDYIGLCDAARLADLTGLNVIDAFPSRDLAQGGCGGPILALPQWILLRHQQKTRLLIEVDRVIRITYLPASRLVDAPTRIEYAEANPGARLLCRIANHVKCEPVDPVSAGDLASLSTAAEELIQQWLSISSDRPTVATWTPCGLSCTQHAAAIVQAVNDKLIALHEALPAATGLVAESLVRLVRQKWLSVRRIDEIVFTGSSAHRPALLAEVRQRLPDVPMLAPDDLQVPSESISSAAAGLLALFHLDQVPGNLPAVTGARMPRVLGRLTPGSPQNWHRVVRQIVENRPVISLRSAL